MCCAFLSCRWTALLSPARLGPEGPTDLLPSTAPNTHSVAWMRCTFSADPGRRSCIRYGYGQHRPRSQQIYHEAMQRCCLRRGSDRTSVPGTARIASGHNRSIAKHCFTNTHSLATAWMRCTSLSRPWTALRCPLWSTSAKSQSKMTVASSSATCFRPRHFLARGSPFENIAVVSRAPVGRVRMRLIACAKGSLINTRLLPYLRLQSEQQALQHPLLKSFCVLCVFRKKG